MPVARVGLGIGRVLPRGLRVVREGHPFLLLSPPLGHLLVPHHCLGSHALGGQQTLHSWVDHPEHDIGRRRRLQHLPLHQWGRGHENDEVAQHIAGPEGLEEDQSVCVNHTGKHVLPVRSALHQTGHGAGALLHGRVLRAFLGALQQLRRAVAGAHVGAPEGAVGVEQLAHDDAVEHLPAGSRKAVLAHLFNLKALINDLLI
mmetsp:Transcript_9570/g.21508  ORF Transcript_9570/g.21508 Transcript_9570/m.21508 type:complete len:202 (-) Transcript_9570:449-1054(-)